MLTLCFPSPHAKLAGKSLDDLPAYFSDEEADQGEQDGKRPTRKAAGKASDKVSKYYKVKAKSKRAKGPAIETEAAHTNGLGDDESGLNQSDEESVMAVNFEDANDTDPTDIMGKLHQILLTYDGADIVKWINRLEIKMESYGVASQWSKRIVLENNLPSRVQDDLNSLLQLRKAEAATKKPNIYKDVKTMLLKIHGPKPHVNYRKALTLVATGPPSHTAKALRDLICKKNPPITDCCCGIAIEARWHDLIPPIVKTSVANLSLVNDFDGTVDYADQVYYANQPSEVAAIDFSTPPPPTSTGEVAAYQRGRGRGNYSRGRGNRARGRGGPRTRPPPPDPNDKSTWGSPHPDGPPPNACMNHYRHGRGAYYCRAESTCAWRDLKAPPADDK